VSEDEGEEEEKEEKKKKKKKKGKEGEEKENGEKTNYSDIQLLKYNNVSKQRVNIKSTETQYLHYDRVSRTCVLQFIIYEKDLEMQYELDRLLS
jgi:hypothetical protein